MTANAGVFLGEKAALFEASVLFKLRRRLSGQMAEHVERQRFEAEARSLPEHLDASRAGRPRILGDQRNDAGVKPQVRAFL